MENIDLLIYKYLIPLNFKLNSNNDLNGFNEYILVNNAYKIYIHHELKITKFYVFDKNFSDMKLIIDDYRNIITFIKDEFKHDLRKITINKILNDK